MTKTWPVCGSLKDFKTISCVMVFSVLFSYRTKHESAAGDHFWKIGCQHSIFGCIGDQEPHFRL